MIDTHAHVHARAFDKDRPEVLARAWQAGLRHIVEVSIAIEDWPKVQALAALDPRISITVGVHPHDTARSGLDRLDGLFRFLDAPEVRGIGETGLDYYRDYSPHDVQQAFFRRHVAAARESGLPVVVHSREAHADVLRILEEEGRGSVRGVLHCFSGDEAIAERARSLGFLLGFGGAATYNPKRSGPLIRAVGLEAIVLETDCPYLTPHPRRHDRNEPANIPVIARAIADYLALDAAEVERVTDENAIRLFDLPR